MYAKPISMALTLARHPELAGLARFLTACHVETFTLNSKDKCYHIVVAGVHLRITQDQEYVVEADLFAAKATTTSAAALRKITQHSHSVRNAYRPSRLESAVGRKRLVAYRILRGDMTAALFIAKSRMTGGRAPPATVAISAIRYYVRDMSAANLGLDKYPEFMDLINGIDLLPGCELNVELRAKRTPHEKPQELLELDSEDDEDEDEVSSTPEDTAIPPPASFEELVSLAVQSRDRGEAERARQRELAIIVAARKQTGRKVNAEQERSRIALSSLRQDLEKIIETQRQENTQLKDDKSQISQDKAVLEVKVTAQEEIIELHVKKTDDLQARVKLLEEERKDQTEKSLVLANPSRCGAYAEKSCGPHIAAAFEEFGKMGKTAGIESHCADFVQANSPWFTILHELKYGLFDISSQEGVDKVLFDIEHTESKYGRPVLAATLIAWRSNVSTMAETPISFRIAPNGHTLLVCINNVQKQSGTGGQDPILRQAFYLVKQHVENCVNKLYLLSALGVKLTAEIQAKLLPSLVRQTTGAASGTGAEKFLVDLIKKNIVVTGSKSSVTNFEDAALSARCDIQSRGRPQVRSAPGVRTGSRNWDTPRSVSRHKTVLIDDIAMIAEATVDDQGVMAEAIDEKTGMSVRAEIDRESGDMAAAMITDDTIGTLTRDGITGAMVGKFTDQKTGSEIEYVHYRGQNTNCVNGIEVARHVPIDWQVLFETKKGWGPAVIEISKEIMKSCMLDATSDIRREDLKKRLSDLLVPERVGTEFFKHLKFMLRPDRYTSGKGGLIHGLRFVE